jgi:DinB superfamily
MSPLWKEILWHQFGAAIETLENVLNACPEELWQARLWREQEVQPEFTEFWYVAYHVIFWLDYYSSESASEFTVPPPFTLSELEMDGVLPERVYTKQELQAYLEYARAKCRAKIESLADENEPQRVRNNWRVKTVAELLLYSMRHVQEHAAHLSMLLGQKTDSAPGWVSQVTIL